MLDITSQQVGIHLESIRGQGLLEYFEYEGERFWKIKKFKEHQTFKRDRMPSTLIKIPLENTREYRKAWEFLDRLQGVVDSKRNPTGNGREEKGSKENTNTAAASAAGNGKKGNKNPFNDAEPYALEEYVKSMRTSPLKHMQIIAEYADEKKPEFTTKGQWRAFTNRNVKSAKRLDAYSMGQIGEAFELMQKHRRESKSGYLKKWGLETLEKYLDEIKTK